IVDRAIAVVVQLVADLGACRGELHALNGGIYALLSTVGTAAEQARVALAHHGLSTRTVYPLTDRAAGALAVPAVAARERMARTIADTGTVHPLAVLGAGALA